MVNPFILQATDAMTQIILGIHTLLLGTGGRGCGGPGIRTITTLSEGIRVPDDGGAGECTSVL